MITITTSPLGRGRFRASIEGRYLCDSVSPFLSAARILQREGVPDETPIQSRDEASGVISLISTVGAASRLTVLENAKDGPRFVPYQTFSPERLTKLRASAQERQEASEATSGAPERATASGDDSPA